MRNLFFLKYFQEKISILFTNFLIIWVVLKAGMISKVNIIYKLILTLNGDKLFTLFQIYGKKLLRKMEVLM